MDEKQQVWNSVLGEIELIVSKPQFNTWIKNTYITNMDDAEIVVCVPNTFTRDWLINKFNKTILNSIQTITGKVKKIRYVITESKPSTTTTEDPISSKKIIDIKKTTFNSNSHSTNLPYSPNSPNQSEERMVFQAETYNTTPLNPSYIFDSFIVGSSNELAHAAAKAVAQEPGTRYNPLFIYGGVGLGKTHLIQAIGNEMVQNNKKVCYITSDTFISELISAFRSGQTTNFKQKYRKVDLLIIDDIQFIAGKKSTQEEVFHTFNDLYAHNKQIVITSDRPPNAIKELNDRLKSRFEGGMIADVIPPDYEMRVGILRIKCAQKNIIIDEEVISLIAERVKRNVRELEGILNKIIAQTQLLRNKITPELVSNIIEGSNLHSKRTVNEDLIISIILNHFNITKEGLHSKSRKKELAYPRQIVMYFLREDLKQTFPTIGNTLGGRDHTTVMHAYEKIKKAIETDYSLAQEISLIRNKMYNDYQ